MHWGMDLGGWLAMGFWAVALLVAVWLLVGRASEPPVADAQTIVRARFARGEISETEFERARALLLADQGAQR